MSKRLLVLAVSLAMVLAGAITAGAEEVDRAERALPDSLADLMLETPVTAEGMELAKIEPSLLTASGPVRVSIRLSEDSVAEVAAQGARRAAQRAQARAVRVEQNGVLKGARALDREARKLGAAQKALNAVFVEIDAAALSDLATDPRVLSIHRVVDYEMELFETVPYIGATDVQNAGYDGSGVRVAVLDSGVDYYHAALGGSGNPADYAADDPTIIEPGTFPTAKVVGGYDFVGSDWFSGDPADLSPPEAPDPDPLDDGPGAGHGTHVADIIGGVGGVAPGADIYGVKVCSSISTACSGIALIQGMEFAIDPNGDMIVDDHVDVVNMSLGALYGTAFDDDLSQAVEAATALGVLTVSAAGNGSDKPYVLDTPSAAPSAFAVAQTAVPSALQPLMEVTAPPAIADLYPAVWQSWSAPLTTAIEAPLQYGDGAGGNLNGCAPFAPAALAGYIVLVDRGACNFTLKISNISQAGGTAGIIGLVAPGDPFNGGDGGDRPIDIPGYMISQADSNALKSGLPDTVVRFDPATGIPLIGHMVGSSARGPSMRDNLLKPEIGAPGASVSAIAGTGTGEGPFGGTSGATPMVAGSAALLMEAYPGRTPMEIKAVLMNTAETDIMNLPAFFGGDLAPISRIGGGEVRVDAALDSSVAAWDKAMPSGGLSFGYVDVWKDTTVLRRRVLVHNYGDSAITLDIDSSFRFAGDEASGAVSIHTKPEIKIPAGKTRGFPVRLKIRGALLGGNYMNSGSMGADGSALTMNEFDGYITLEGDGTSIHLPWHVLPRQSARLTGRTNLTFGGGMDTVDLTNTGVGTAQNDAYALVAISPDIPEGPPGGQSPTPDIAAVGINTFPVPAGYCSAEPSFIWAFAVSTHERQSHLAPVNHYVMLDTDQDGTDDYYVLNSDFSGPGGLSDGRQLTWAIDLSTGGASAFFFAEHATNTANTALYICGEQVGLTGTDMLATNVDMDVLAWDFYYGGPSDFIPDLTVTPLGERYYGLPDDIAGKSEGSMTVYDFGPFPGNTPEYGVLLLSNGDRGGGSRGGATADTEFMLFLAP